MSLRAGAGCPERIDGHSGDDGRHTAMYLVARKTLP
jgi:hypothetical protein